MEVFEEKSQYINEWKKGVLRCKELIVDSSDYEYFFQLAHRQGEIPYDSKECVICLGCNIPVEEILALGKRPFYVVGGSLVAATNGESVVPRDTDSVTKSILGVLNMIQEQGKSGLVLLPIHCDSMRKLKVKLEQQFQVVVLEIPSNRNNPRNQQRWILEIEQLKEQLEYYYRRHIWKRTLNQKIDIVQHARASYRLFHRTCDRNPGCIPGTLKMFLMNSFLWCDDYERWAIEIEKITKRIQEKPLFDSNRPKILLMGSPIYFPCYKIPFLLEELGMDIVAVNHPLYSILQMDYERYGDQRAIQWLDHDGSAAFVDNHTLYEQGCSLQEYYHVDGVIYHVLKGQIEYDFELRKYESYFEQQHVPVFRLETDYYNQDIEQLKIRLEAFREMVEYRQKIS